MTIHLIHLLLYIIHLTPTLMANLESPNNLLKWEETKAAAENHTTAPVHNYHWKCFQLLLFEKET